MIAAIGSSTMVKMPPAKIPPRIPIATGDGEWSYDRAYIDDTLVLETTIHGPTGELRLLDCFLMGDVERSHPDRQILRVIEGKRGTVELEIELAPRFDYGEVRPWLRR